ncbi:MULTISPECIES: hypothetical protein [unclassified Thioalkalivibrio]|uniref:chorismate transformation enzyme, FkbO/Hyg5 family n=1 Tax=unclassified Thioalkalivibrio TaxID=2621013 RepID=UPI00036EF686|nr:MULTISPECIES: hypothetical protein [unclassified Thioalkalivibrio]
MSLSLRCQLRPEAATGLDSGLHVRLRDPAGVEAGRHTLEVHPGLHPLAPDAYAEYWAADGIPRAAQEGGVHLLEYDDVLFATWVGPDRNLRGRTEEAYRALLAACRTRGFGHLARIWNFFGNIHAEEDGLERYQAFCMGRAEALEALEIPQASMPAATAIGSDRDRLVIYLIATRHPAEPIENPRQVSAYHYPERYSPKSPTFARATRLDTASGPLILLSGTASIVGHESRHPDDVAAQARETLSNLQALHDTAGRELPRPSWLRVYLRHPEDRTRVSAVLAEHYNAAHPGPIVQWVRGDICRRELLLEIEGVHA